MKGVRFILTAAFIAILGVPSTPHPFSFAPTTQVSNFRQSSFLEYKYPFNLSLYQLADVWRSSHQE
jgi:hypothetical protein